MLWLKTEKVSWIMNHDASLNSIPMCFKYLSFVVVGSCWVVGLLGHFLGQARPWGKVSWFLSYIPTFRTWVGKEYLWVIWPDGSQSHDEGIHQTCEESRTILKQTGFLRVHQLANLKGWFCWSMFFWKLLKAFKRMEHSGLQRLLFFSSSSILNYSR